MVRRERKCSWERFLNSHDGIFDNNDTISRLPETVLHHVVSFLPTSDKHEVRFLSRKWRRLAAQSRKKLSLTGRRLDEQELSRILVDDFHSVDFLSLKRCSGMKTLKLVNFNLKFVELNYCRSLKSLELDTPHLENFRFLGPRVRPCRIEFGICKLVKRMNLRCIIISSSSLNDLSLLKFNEPIEITVTAPNLDDITYNGSVICSFSNMNIGSLFSATIELYPRRYQKRNDTWFCNLNEMLQCLKPKRVVSETSSEKNIIIPKHLRQSLMPTLEETDAVEVDIISRTRSYTIDLVNLADSMLWISPRLKILKILIQSLFISRLALIHGDYSRKQENSCGFCTSHPIRCWRHSVTHFHVIGDNENSLEHDIKESLQKVERVAIYGPISIFLA